MMDRRTFTPPDDKPPILTKRTPVDEYDRCRECGTAEGQPCYDSHDKPLASVCVGRTLSSRGSLDRETRKKYKQKKARTGGNIMIELNDTLHPLLVDEQRSRSILMAEIHKRIAADAITIAHLEAKLATAEKCARCDAIATARALAGVETINL